MLRYGDEIGMGDNLTLPHRESVRTPMQWSAEPNGGFSTAPPDQLALPLIDDGDYAYTKVNVEVQRLDPQSLLNWLERMTRLRKEHPAFGVGDCTFLDTGQPELLAHRCDHDGHSMFALHNLGARRARFTLDLGDGAGELHDVLRGRRREAPQDGRCRIELEPFGYSWLRLEPR